MAARCANALDAGAASSRGQPDRVRLGQARAPRRTSGLLERLAECVDHRTELAHEGSGSCRRWVGGIDEPDKVSPAPSTDTNLRANCPNAGHIRLVTHP
jgi:hypothetical protein